MIGNKGLDATVGALVALIIGVIFVGGIIIFVGNFYKNRIPTDPYCPLVCNFRERWDYSPWDDTASTFASSFRDGFELGLYNPVPGSSISFGLAGGAWSSIKSTVINKAKEWAAPEPESMGCYCGVNEGGGKYLHVKFDPNAEEIWEFHFTEQDPSLHNEYSVPDTIAHGSDCDIDETWDQYRNSSSCLIFSVEEDGDADDKCELYNVTPGTKITGQIGENIKSEIVDSGEIESLERTFDSNDENPLQDVRFGDEVDFKGNPGGRMLLKFPKTYGSKGVFVLNPENITCIGAQDRAFWTIEEKGSTGGIN